MDPYRSWHVVNQIDNVVAIDVRNQDSSCVSLDFLEFIRNDLAGVLAGEQSDYAYFELNQGELIDKNSEVSLDFLLRGHTLLIASADRVRAKLPGRWESSSLFRKCDQDLLAAFRKSVNVLMHLKKVMDAAKHCKHASPAPYISWHQVLQIRSALNSKLTALQMLGNPAIHFIEGDFASFIRGQASCCDYFDLDFGNSFTDLVNVSGEIQLSKLKSLLRLSTLMCCWRSDTGRVSSVPITGMRNESFKASLSCLYGKLELQSP